MKKETLNRRGALTGLGSLAATGLVFNRSAAADDSSQNPVAPKVIGEPPGRITPAGDLVNTLECEEMAARSLPARTHALIAGGDRSYFERVTFRPRMMTPTVDMNQSVDLFGQKLFSPILVGPVAQQQKFHPEGELATARGASAAKTVMVVSSDSSVPIDKIAAEAGYGFWYQAFPLSSVDATKAGIQQAVKAGARVICLTAGVPFRTAGAAPGPAELAKMQPAAFNWNVIDQLRKDVSLPFIIKGIMTPEEADAAVKQGVKGMVVSNYGGLLTEGMATPIEMLAPIVDTVGGRIPVLVDGGFRRGSDIFKGLSLGATAVMVSRPAMWGLAAYGAEGVQTILEMLQGEVGRDMGHAGTPNLKAINRTLVKVHRA
jgi:4-hydroxymandelate oxidase